MNTPDSTKLDFLIVGQGLAGSILAWELINAGKKVLVVDNDHKHASSMAAAGLINPITGKRLVKPDDVEDSLKQALKTYHQLEQNFQQQFYFPTNMLRLFVDEQQASYLQKRKQQPDYQPFLGAWLTEEENEDIENLKKPHGGFHQKLTGFLNIPALLDNFKDYFEKQQSYLNGHFDYADLIIEKNAVRWRNFRANRCIFCEGYLSMHNPWFNWLPFQPAKGEILTIESEDIRTRQIVNASNWLIPLGQGQFRTGANYQWDFEDDLPTVEGKELVKKNLADLFISAPQYEVVAHKAGIRPATRDKKPFIGLHPELKPLGICNGFGARGSLTIPYYAKIFANHLVDNIALPDTANILRYYHDPINTDR